LYYKARLVNALKKGGIQAVQKGIPFPPSSSKPIRKIGNNEVVLRGVEQLLDYLDAGFYVVLVPDSPERVAEFFCDDMLKNTALQEYSEWDVSNYGYICWSEIKGFCSQYNLENTLGVFTFNEGQIY
jgi:hypothetical protein